MKLPWPNSSMLVMGRSHCVPLFKTTALGNFLLLLFLLAWEFPFCFQIPPGDLPLHKYPQPIPKAVGRADFPSWPILPEASVCLLENTTQFLWVFQPTRELRARNSPALGYHYEMNSSLFLSKITFISLV